tara:strand:- start:1363 stop:1479 length:117 start_codon:yes stop_codon:yes gene_type:complete
LELEEREYQVHDLLGNAKEFGESFNKLAFFIKQKKVLL